MNYLPDLRASLVSAAERAAAAPTPRPDDVPARIRPRRWPLAGLRALPVALGVVIAVAITVLALTQVRHAPTQPKPATRQPSGRQALVAILAVLRRPQTSADRNSPILTNNLRALAQGAGAALGVTPDYPLIRRATTTPWGSPVFLVPVKPLPVKAIHPARGSTAYAPLRRQTGEGLMEVDRSGSGGDATASAIEAGHFLGTTGAGRSFAGGSTGTRVILVVPDGVAKVAFVFPRQTNRSDPGAPVYRRSLTMIAPVDGNVAAIQVPRECCGSNVPMIWYGADGHVVKRLGNFADVNRVLPTPKPGPETSQSRAADRDPPTPNHVWVSPSSGGPHTNYTVHFRILLNDADYRFAFSGTSCPRSRSRR